MKKTSFLLLLVLISTLSFSSCFYLIPWTFKKDYSELPANESAIVVFTSARPATMKVRKWNDQDIYKTLYGPLSSEDENDKAQLTVPPGDNIFTFDISFKYGDDYYEARNTEIRYNLDPGTKYIVKARINTIKSKGAATKREFFVGIYPDVKKSEPLKEWRLGES